MAGIGVAYAGVAPQAWVPRAQASSAAEVGAVGRPGQAVPITLPTQAQASRESRDSRDSDEEEEGSSPDGSEEWDPHADAVEAPATASSRRTYDQRLQTLFKQGALRNGMSDCDLAWHHFGKQFRGFGVKKLFSMNTMAVLSAWHAFGAWLATCILVCTAMRMLLQGYVDWLMITLHQDEKIKTMDVYFATFLRSWFVVCFFSDLVRFCFWFGRDAWRADTFEGYRRTVILLGEGAMQGGHLYSQNWPEKALELRYRVADTLVQVALYFSLDVVPIYLGAQKIFSGGSAQSKNAVNTVFKALAISSLVHIVIFWAFWLITDLRLKYREFRTARQGRFRNGTSFIGAVVHDWSPFAKDEEEEEVEMDERGGDSLLAKMLKDKKYAGQGFLKRLARGEKASDSDDDSTSEPTWQMGSDGELHDGPSIADRLNLCVAVCRVSRFVVSHMFWIILFYLGLGGLGKVKIWLVALAVIFALSQSSLTMVQLFGLLKWFNFRHRLPNCCLKQSKDKTLWALQDWGETCLGLSPDVQFKRRAIFGIVVALQAVLFGVIGWGDYMIWCLLLLSVSLKQLTVRSEAPWGWLVGLLEGAIMFLVTGFFMIVAFGPQGRWGLVLQTLLLVLAHQCGLQRKDYTGIAGGRVVRAVTAFLSVVLIIILAVVLVSADDTHQAAGTMFCTPNSKHGCANYTVPWKEPSNANTRACSTGMVWGQGARTYSLTDFGLFAAIAYESEETILPALNQFFPGWRMEFSHRATEFWLGDWTTFFDFTSPDNRTTVIAVRGTQTSVDALNDIVIWMPAAVMQVFSSLGPDIAAPTAQAINDVSSRFGLAQETYIAQLLNHTVTIMQEHPEREFFIAGHSLGGGLAKIVSMRALSMGLTLPAITFMSPGLGATRFLIFDQQTQVEAFIHATRESAHIFTLMPENDVVSRIDWQVGIVVPINCPEGSPLTCHGIFTGLCHIFERCGSSRYNESLSLPCGVCGRLPCPAPAAGSIDA